MISQFILITAIVIFKQYYSLFFVPSDLFVVFPDLKNVLNEGNIIITDNDDG